METIIDLHCDLLCYLANDSARKATDLHMRCSIPKLLKGQVALQTMAIFTETAKNSSISGQKQLLEYEKLSKNFKEVEIIKECSKIELKKGCIQTLLAIENLSSLVEEDGSLDTCFQQLERIIQQHKLLYITPTWNLENRFGGGAHTKIGLKSDGKKLLDFLHKKKIAIDLSHTSDALAHDILNYISKFQLNIPIIASHSNFRAVTDVPRNLPDELSKEIILQKGLIGFVFYKAFIGSDINKFCHHFEHLLKLGGEKSGCFGADFFYGEDLPDEFKKQDSTLFYEEYPDATAYPKLLKKWQDKNLATEEVLKGIAYQNFLNFYQNFIG